MLSEPVSFRNSYRPAGARRQACTQSAKLSDSLQPARRDAAHPQTGVLMHRVGRFCFSFLRSCSRGWRAKCCEGWNAKCRGSWQGVIFIAIKSGAGDIHSSACWEITGLMVEASRRNQWRLVEAACRTLGFLPLLSGMWHQNEQGESMRYKPGICGRREPPLQRHRGVPGIDEGVSSLQWENTACRAPEGC